MNSLDSLGRDAGLAQSSLSNNYLSLYETYMASADNGRFSLLIITNVNTQSVANVFADRFPDSEIIIASYGAGKHSIFKLNNVTYAEFDSINELLSHDFVSQFNFVIEHSSNKKSHKLKLLNKFFLNVKSGGSYFIEELHAKFIQPLLDIDGDDVFDVINKASQLKIAPPKIRSSYSGITLAIADCCEMISIRGKLGILNKNMITLKGIRNQQTKNIIGIGSVAGQILMEDKGEYTFSHKNTSTINLSKNSHRHPKSFKIPASFVARYDNASCYPGQLIYKDSFLLADSFRIQHHKKLQNKNSIPLFEDYFIVGDGVNPTKELKGEYFYLDSEYPCHFGHFTSEVISRLWAWDDLKAANPKMKVLIGLNKGSSLPDFMVKMLVSYGVNLSDIVTFDDGVNVETIYSATPYYVIGSHIDPRITDIWNRVGSCYKSGTSGISGKKLFIARPENGKRNCLNPERLEDIFKKKGFEFYNPEKHSWVDQLKTFSSATQIAGYAGSGTFNAMFSNSVKKMFIIGSDSYTASNEHYICAIKGVDLSYFWGDSLLEHNGGWSHQAFMSDYNFNYDRDEDDLIRSL